MIANEVRSWAIFTIRGNILPDQITRDMKMEPDRVFADGKDRVWQINSTLGATETTEAHFHELLLRLLPQSAMLRKLATDHYLEFYCFLEKPQEMSLPITLSPRILLLCGYLRAHVDVEVKDLEISK